MIFKNSQNFHKISKIDFKTWKMDFRNSQVDGKISRIGNCNQNWRKSAMFIASCKVRIDGWKRRKSGYKLQFCFARCNRELKVPFCKLANFCLQRYLRCINQTSHFSIDERLHADRTFWKVSYCRQWMLELDRTHQNFSSTQFTIISEA